MVEPSDRVEILIVDDKLDKLLALEAALEDLGEHVVRATSGRDALRFLLRQEFAVILMDINMPGLDGFETAELLRRHRGTRQTPIIFLTASGEDLHVARSYSLGAVDYILTPVDPDVLRAKVGVFVDLFRKTLEVKQKARSLERRTEQLRLLTRASLTINAVHSVEGILRAAADAAREILGVHQAMATTSLGPTADRAPHAVSLSEQHAAARGYRPRARFEALERLLGQRGSLWLTEAELSARADLLATLAEPGRPPLRGLLAAPLLDVDGSVIGLLQLSDPIEGDPSLDDEPLLVQLAQLASTAIQNVLHAEAREANRLKDEFLATLSHELRTPLNAILGWTRILRAGPSDPAKAARALEVIERNVGAQTRLIEELLDASRIATGKLRIHPRPLALRPLLESGLDALRPAAEARSVRLTAALDDVGQVKGDPDRLHQVISNVLGNALKFTPKGGRIEVGLCRKPGHAELVVSDDGDGISPEFLPFVFDRFRQADSSLRRTQGGLGIGLSVVRHLVELHGGSVEAESAGLGRGATFTVRLPLLLDGAGDATPPPGSDEPPPSSLEGIHVLLVDDDDDAREVLKEVLQQERAQVTAVASASEALAALDRQRPDVMVSDLAMPGTDGFELMRRVRARAGREDPPIPALALTANARVEDQSRALEAGFHMHVAKPVEPAVLVARVAGLVRSAGVR